MVVCHRSQHSGKGRLGFTLATRPVARRVDGVMKTGKTDRKGLFGDSSWGPVWKQKARDGRLAGIETHGLSYLQGLGTELKADFPQHSR